MLCTSASKNTVYIICRYTGHTLAKFFVTLATGLVTGLTAAACAGTLEFVFYSKQLAVQYLIDIVKHKTLFAAFGLHLLITTALLMFAACLVGITHDIVCGWMTINSATQIIVLPLLYL